MTGKIISLGDLEIGAWIAVGKNGANLVKVTGIIDGGRSFRGDLIVDDSPGSLAITDTRCQIAEAECLIEEEDEIRRLDSIAQKAVRI